KRNIAAVDVELKKIEQNKSALIAYAIDIEVTNLELRGKINQYISDANRGVVSKKSNKPEVDSTFDMDAIRRGVQLRRVANVEIDPIKKLESQRNSEQGSFEKKLAELQKHKDIF